MNKAKEISALWSQIKPQIGEMVRLCHEVEDHAEVTADAYQRGYENGFIAGHLKAEKSGQSFYEDGYQRGLNDAWEAARKICTNWVLPDSVLSKIFGKDKTIDDIMRENTASEAIATIRAYEQKKEEQIQVGDEVEDGVANLIVLEINQDGTVSGFDDAGSIIHATPRKKTGRHFPEIAEVLQKMKES